MRKNLAKYRVTWTNARYVCTQFIIVERFEAIEMEQLAWLSHWEFYGARDFTSPSIRERRASSVSSITSMAFFRQKKLDFSSQFYSFSRGTNKIKIAFIWWIDLLMLATFFSESRTEENVCFLFRFKVWVKSITLSLPDAGNFICLWDKFQVFALWINHDEDWSILQEMKALAHFDEKKRYFGDHFQELNENANHWRHGK